MTTKISDRFEKRFAELSAKGEGAFVPFVNLCDPDSDTSEAVIEALVAGGADALELGIPFSDPCADGPVIQASAGRALAAGSTTEKCLAVLSRVRTRHPDLPMSLMLYINLVMAPGIENFFKKAAAAGADAVLIPDLPISMRKAEPEWDRAAAQAGINLIAIAPPKADGEILKSIAAVSTGYVYLLSRAGITGTDKVAERPKVEEIEALRSAGSAPLLLGFGISEPAHVRSAIEAGADGAISGSAVVKIIDQNLADKSKMLQELTAFAATMKAATKK